MNNELKRKILLKVICSVLLLGILVYLINFKTSNYNSLHVSDKLSTTSYKMTYARYIEKFISYIKLNDFDSSYNMLSDECKNERFNNIKDFENYVNNFDFRSEYIIQYIREYKNIDNKYTCIYKCNFKDKTMYVYVIQEIPFKYKLYLVS